MNIQRIVSLAPSNTEIIFALGLESRLVGVTEYCNYPPKAKLKEKIGGFSTPDINKIVSISPDLVLATDFHFHLGVVSQLKAKGLCVYAIDSKTILDAPQAISSVGKLIGCQRKASQLAGQLQEKIEKIVQKVEASKQKPSVCYICSHDPFCIARKSCAINKLIEIAGGINVIQDVALDNIDNLLEAVIKKNPQVIITSKGHRETTDLLSYVKSHSHFQHTDAYLNNRIYQIDAELICRPGPRAVQGLELLAKFIHPESFGQD